MSNYSKSRSFFALIVSGSVHIGFAMFLFAIPKAMINHYDIVDMAVNKIEEKKIEEPEEPEPEPEPEPDPEPEPKKKMKKAPAPEPAPEPEPEDEPPPPPPVEEKPPEVKEEAPPVFDLGDNTFATGDGQGASWNLRRSEGNTRFASVAKKTQPSVRNTKPIVQKQGKPGGTGTKPVNIPVPLKDLSRRPMPKNGPVPIPPYPPEAKRAGIEGPVVLKIYIDKKGRVRRTQVVQSPDTILAKVAQNVMGNVVWTPPLDKMGNPVDTVIVWRFRFVLDG
jgi:TonB family protein